MPITEEKRVKDFPPRQSGLLPADVIPVDSNAGGTGSVTVQQLMEANISGLTTDATTVIAAINELKAQGFKTIALTQAQYDLLPDTKLTDGIAYYITDGVPDVDNALWTKVGRDPLDTTASDCSGAINELKQSLSDLEDSLEDSYTNLSLNSSIVNTIYIRNIFKFGNIKIANVGYLSKAISTLNTWYELCTLPTGYENLHALEFQWFTRDKKSINIKVENNKIWIVARESVGNNDLINVYIPFI